MSARATRKNHDSTKTLEPLDEIVRANLKRFREEADLRQADAAELAGVPIDNLRRYELGITSTVPGTALRLLSVIYGHTVDDFFAADPPPPRLDDRPVFFLRTHPGVEVDSDLLRKLQQMVDSANNEIRMRRKGERLA